MPAVATSFADHEAVINGAAISAVLLVAAVFREDHFTLLMVATVLLYVLACRQKNESLCFPVEGVDGGSISMLSVQIG